MKRSMKFAALAAMVSWLGPAAHATNTPVDATITVTPVADVTLSFTGSTTYDFGSLDVAVSSISATSLVLKNDSEVNVEVNKHIENNGGWTHSGTVGVDTFSLHVATAAARPSDIFGANHLFPNNSGAQNRLRGIGNGTPQLAPDATAELWFRLGMPTTVSSQAQKTITVRFTGVAL
jgi:hypothetical protein